MTLFLSIMDNKIKKESIVLMLENTIIVKL